MINGELIVDNFIGVAERTPNMKIKTEQTGQLRFT